MKCSQCRRNRPLVDDLCIDCGEWDAKEVLA